MSKKLYVSSAGTLKNVKCLYVGINKVSRKIIKGYIGINNTARLFWKYVTYKMVQQSASLDRFHSISWDVSCKLPTSMVFDTTTGKFILSDLRTLEIDDGGSVRTFYTTNYTIKRSGREYYLAAVDAISDGTYDGPIYKIETHRFVWPSENSASSVRCYVAEEES